MPIFKIKNKLILFLHIPKAGGTSVEQWLTDLGGSESLRLRYNKISFPCVPQHFHGDLIDALFAPGFFDYSFAVPRNPYWRLLSEYNYRMGHRRWYERWYPTPSFSLWVNYVLSRYKSHPYIYSNHIRPQVEFAIDNTETYRLEDQLPQLYGRIGQMLDVGTVPSLPQANRSVTRQAVIDAATAEKIHTFYRKDFETFGYDESSYKSIS